MPHLFLYTLVQHFLKVRGSALYISKECYMISQIPSTVLVGMNIWPIYSGLGLHVNRMTSVERLVKVSTRTPENTFWNQNCDANPYTLQFCRRCAYQPPQSAIACEVAYGCCLPPVKLSILYFYHRIFPSRRLYQVAVSIAISVVASGITQFVGWSLQCVPLSKAWTGGPGRCISASVFATSMALSILGPFTLIEP